MFTTFAVALVVVGSSPQWVAGLRLASGALTEVMAAVLAVYLAVARRHKALATAGASSSAALLLGGARHRRGSLASTRGAACPEGAVSSRLMA